MPTFSKNIKKMSLKYRQRTLHQFLMLQSSYLWHTIFFLQHYQALFALQEISFWYSFVRKVIMIIMLLFIIIAYFPCVCFPIYLAKTMLLLFILLQFSSVAKEVSNQHCFVFQYSSHWLHRITVSNISAFRSCIIWCFYIKF